MQIADLPAINATLNGLAAIILITGQVEQDVRKAKGVSIP